MMANSYDKSEATTILLDSKADISLVEQIASGSHKLLKYTSLITLTAQNAALSLTMRMARTQEDLFLASSAVIMAEIIKLVTCLGLILIDEGSFIKAVSSVYNTVVRQPVDTFKVAIPSLVYTLQNNLIYVGATHLDAATCQVTYQLKILTTALFSVAMLRKRLSALQWASLALLFIGVAMVQLAQISTPQTNPAGRTQYPLFGFCAIFTACCLSGFAGVYFEKILKGSDVSVWMRNIQLSTFAIPFGIATLLINDYSELRANGFFFGYSILTWIVILLQALGGLIVAMVVKYADNIMKGFATSLAIVLACVVSVYTFQFHLTMNFVIGAGLVISSIFLYSQPSLKTSQDFKK